MNNFTYKTKYDYLKLGDRADVHSTIREDIYEKLMIVSVKTKQPMTKYFDCMIEMILDNPDLKSQLIDRVRNYR